MYMSIFLFFVDRVGYVDKDMRLADFRKFPRKFIEESDMITDFLEIFREFSLKFPPIFVEISQRTIIQKSSGKNLGANGNRLALNGSKKFKLVLGMMSFYMITDLDNYNVVDAEASNDGDEPQWKLRNGHKNQQLSFQGEGNGESIYIVVDLRINKVFLGQKFL